MTRAPHVGRRPQWRAGLCPAGAVLVVASVGGCIWAPNIAPDGYVSCAADKDCDPGRSCEEHVCAPPPWDDEQFGSRRLLTVNNGDDKPLPKGTAVPVSVGGDGADLPLDEVGPDFRIVDFDEQTGAWHVVPVFLDRLADRFTAWIPTQREIAQGRTGVLAYIEADTFDKVPTVVEDPSTTFADFDGFDDGLDDTRWRVTGTPNVDGGIVNVGDEQAVVLRRQLTPPVLMTALVRINGRDCGQVFVGLIGDDQSLFNVGPSAGVFVSDQLAAAAQVAPDENSTPTPLGDSFVATNSFARVTVAVDGGGVFVGSDDTVAYQESDLRPPFSDAPMFAAIQVHGACSVDVDALWTTPLPQPLPVVAAADAVHFQLFE